MARVALCLAFLFASLSVAESKEKKFDAGGVEVKIDMKKAKFKVYRKNAGENETNQVEIEWKHVEEVDADGKEAHKDGPKDERHSIKDFKKQDFTFEDPTTVDLCPSADFPNITNSATATKLSFNSGINNIGKIKVDTFIVEKAGVAGPDEESLWYVSPGDMKFNVELSDWKFCGSPGVTCKHGAVGEFIDVQVKIKGKSSAPAMLPEGQGAPSGEGKGKGKGKGKSSGRAGKGKKSDFDMGGNIALSLTNLVDVDGNVTEMPAGYPLMEQKGKDSYFTFRFPKFTNKIVYDPLLTTGEKVEGPGGGSAATTGQIGVVDSAGLSGLNIVVFGALLLKFFY